MSFSFDLIPAPLVTVYFLSEALVQRHRRKDGYAEDRDDGSLSVVMLAFIGGILLCWVTMQVLPQARMAFLQQLFMPAIGVFVLGLILRWYAILHLGRYFTVQVAIASDHKLIETGLFRFLRHPSYTGVLLQLLAIGVRSGNAVALLVLMLPAVAALVYRMRIEEAALTEAFGERYVEYMGRTKRLLPFLY